MSYSTRENLQDTEKALAFARELTELYPDARCDGGLWFSGNVALNECDVVELRSIQERGPRRGVFNIELYCGKRLPSGGVIWSSYGYQAFRLLPSFMTADSNGAAPSPREDALRKALLAWAAGAR